MSKYFFSCVILLFGIAHGQGSDDNRYGNGSIYEYGKPLTSCECNFENLFQNWDRWIRNSQDTELLSYSYITTIEDSIQIDYYAELSNNWMIEKRGANGVESLGDSVIYWQEWSFSANPWKLYADSIAGTLKNASQIKLFYAEMESIRKKMIDKFKNNVQIGDKIYLITIKTQRILYDNYVVCSSDNKIVWDYLFADINIK